MGINKGVVLKLLLLDILRRPKEMEGRRETEIRHKETEGAGTNNKICAGQSRRTLDFSLGSDGACNDMLRIVS